MSSENRVNCQSFLTNTDLRPRSKRFLSGNQDGEENQDLDLEHKLRSDIKVFKKYNIQK